MVDPLTEAHDVVLSAMLQVEAAWRLRQENPALLRQTLDNFHTASAAYAKTVERQEAEAAGGL
jgi:hypothetical protein